ncbi:ATP-dependent RNA helicase, partial [Lunasporangiospora selenospora]
MVGAHSSDLHSNGAQASEASTKEEAEPRALSKTQRKRARHQQGSLTMTEEEVSLTSVPALPTVSKEVVPVKKGRKIEIPVKGKGKGAKGVKKSRMGKIVSADFNHVDDWGWTPVSTDGMHMDDMEGFLCLEELDGVDVAYEGTEETGRTVVFKHDPAVAAAKKDKSVKHSEPLEVKDDDVYYDIDTFDEGALAKQQQERPKKTTKGEDSQMSSNEEPKETTEMQIDTEEKDSSSKPAKKQPLKKQPLKEAAISKQKASKKEPEVESDNEDDEESEAEEEEEEEEMADSNDDAASKKLTKRELGLLKLEKLKVKREAAKVAKAAKAELKAQQEPVKAFDPMEGVNQKFDISKWKDYRFSPLIQNALKKKEFGTPTSIQEEALPLALAGRDVVGVAETGSGKTLAFGLPIIQCLAQQAELAAASNTPLQETLTALILTPTRELAIQIKDHLVAFTQFTGHHIVPIVGGMSIQKQTRQMDRQPSIIVATPGRLWELISTNPVYTERLANVRYLVLDEADRMLESGHFEELSSILKVLERKREMTSEWDQHVKKTEQEDKEGPVQAVSIAKTDYEHSRQTLNLTRKNNRAKSMEKDSVEGSMEALMDRIEFQDETPALVNVTSDKIVASRLLEAKIDCLTEEKDAYLYYFLKKYPGRTLVFVNSIDAIRHVVPMMQLLGVDALGLHAQMQQRQRLKNLDRFKSNPHAVMVASDVAARGLDIPMVDHVIHYQVPRSGDIYVHRSGRTARAQNEGISLLICGPDEVQLYRKMCITLKKDQTGGIPEFPVEHGIVTEMKKRVTLAKNIDAEEHRVQK